MSKIDRRSLLQLVGASSSLCFMPNLGLANTTSIPDRSLPKIRSVIRLQMYAGWDVAMSCDPPREQYHAEEVNGQSAWLTHWNFPSGVMVDRSGFTFGDGRRATAEQAIQLQQLINNRVGSDFFSRTDRGVRLPNGFVPGQSPTSFSEFVNIRAQVGSTGQPFPQVASDPGWTRVSGENPEIALGPLMHQFLDKIDASPSGEQFDESYLNNMTIINGIDTSFNVSHDAGAVLAACGVRPAGVGNGTDLTALQFRASIESIIAHQLIGHPDRFLPHLGLEAPLVPNLTFTYPGFRRGYAHSTAMTNLAGLQDVVSLADLNAKSAIENPEHISLASLQAMYQRLGQEAKRSRVAERAYLGLQGILERGGLGLEDFGEEERQAFAGMIDIVLDKSVTRPADAVIPGIQFRDRSGGMLTDYINTDPERLRLALDHERTGSWQNNLATAAMLVRKGLTRGVSISFGGHVNFIPDTHWHNDYVQMIYQGQFWDGVKRLINYLKWNRDPETGESLLDSTLVIVTGDIIRGPVYFDQGIHGKSDFRNNSMVLFGGGLDHNTKEGEATRPGRRIGYSFSGLEAGRIDINNGKDAPRPSNANERREESITYEKIYSSLLAGYGMDHIPYFQEENLIQPLARNRKKNEGS